MRYKTRLLHTIQIVPYDTYGTDAWITTFSLIIVWTQLTVLRTMIVYVPKVSHNTFDVSGYDTISTYSTTPNILHPPVPHKYLLYLLILWPLVSYFISIQNFHG